MNEISNNESNGGARPELATPICYAFRAGDHVKHGPTGEEWELACDERHGDVMPSGWPSTIAKASDCTLIEAATDEKRMKVLTAWAKTGRGREAENDWRTLTARRQLSSPNVEDTRDVKSTK